jgi:hypothetical protein
MHMLDEGVFKRFTAALLDTCTPKDVSTIEQRLVAWSRAHPTFKPLPHNVGELTGLEASHLVTIMQLLPLAIADIVDHDTLALAADWPDLYESCIAYSFTNADLIDLKLRINTWTTAMIAHYSEAVSNGNFPKLHLFLKHFVDFIRRYGTAMGFHTGTWEGFHAIAIKRPYKRSNHKNVLKHFATQDHRRAIVSLLHRTVSSNASALHPPPITTTTTTPSLFGKQQTKTIASLSKDVRTAITGFVTNDTDANRFAAVVTHATTYSGFKPLNSQHYVRAAEKFHGRERHDDVVVQAAGTEWYGTVTHFMQLHPANYDATLAIDIAIVQWYEEAPPIDLENDTFVNRGCIRLMRGQTDAISVSSIIRRINIVPDVCNADRFLVNSFCFLKNT